MFTGGDLADAMGCFGYLLVALVLLAPLGAWKLIEIVLWLIQHLRIV